MDKKKKAGGDHNEFPLRDEMTLAGAVSATDCTGLVPTGRVDSADELDETNKLLKHAADPKKS